MMLAELALLLVLWRPAFARKATWVRVVSVLLGLVVGDGRRTVTSSLIACGRRDASWSADYLAFSRAPWEVDDLFYGVVQAGVALADSVAPRHRYLWVGIDDSTIPRSGAKISAARWYRDPMSPPFHFNLQRGLRYVHMGLLLPLHTLGLDARALSIDFVPAPSVRKPGKRATAAEVEAFKVAKKRHNLSQVAADRVRCLREKLDAGGDSACKSGRVRRPPGVQGAAAARSGIGHRPARA